MATRGKSIVYFDNSNIFKGQIAAGWRIDVEKFIALLEKGGQIWQTYFFAAVTDPPRYMQTAFYSMLKEKLRWETILFPLGNKTFHCKKCNTTHHLKTEKGVDVGLASKMLVHSINKAFETAILVSGDKDYLETVKTIKNLGLRVEIVSFRNSLSVDLARESSSPIIFLDDHKNELELKKPDPEVEKLSNPENEEV